MGQSPGHRLAAHSSQLLVMLGHDANEHGTPQNTHPRPQSARNHPLLIRSHSLLSFCRGPRKQRCSQAEQGLGRSQMPEGQRLWGLWGFQSSGQESGPKWGSEEQRGAPGGPDS